MIVNLNQRSTLTVPAEIRRRLGISPGDPLDLTVHDGSLEVSPAVIFPTKASSFTFREGKRCLG